MRVDMPPIISFVGKSNSGKTTLVEKLIPQIRRRGYRVGVLKHHTHDFEFDIRGKDTWRHKQAGAEVVVLATPTGIGLVRDTAHDLSVDELVGLYYQDVDLVITEGYKRGAHPKIEVFRAENHKKTIEDRDDSWIAFITDSEIDTELPVFDINDDSGVADFVVCEIIKAVNT